VRVVDDGLSTGGEPEVEFTGAVSDLSADVLEALSSFSCFSAGRWVRFSDLGVPAFSALRSEVVGCSNRRIVATATDGSRPSAGQACSPS
jgi:hypothetical protein